VFCFSLPPNFFHSDFKKKNGYMIFFKNSRDRVALLRLVLLVHRRDLLLRNTFFY
jgi:adenine specific DNA methylase Mod